MDWVAAGLGHGLVVVIVVVPPGPVSVVVAVGGLPAPVFPVPPKTPWYPGPPAWSSATRAARVLATPVASVPATMTVANVCDGDRAWQST